MDTSLAPSSSQIRAMASHREATGVISMGGFSNTLNTILSYKLSASHECGMFFNNLLIWLSVFLQDSVQGAFRRKIFLNPLYCCLLRVTFPGDWRLDVFVYYTLSSTVKPSQPPHPWILPCIHSTVRVSREFGFVGINKSKSFQPESIRDTGFVWLGPHL